MVRSEFEKLPGIAILIREGEASYHESKDWYLCENIDCSAIELALDTAWYAFQEQQKKIDAITDLCNNRRGDIHWQVDSFIEEIEGLLK